MQSFAVVASLVLELAGGGSNCPPLGTNVSENALGFQGLIDDEKFNLMHNVWKLDMSYQFPVTIEAGGVCKRFVHQWLNRYRWLAYSKYLDGAFCLPCVLLGTQTGHNGAKLDKLLKSPLTYWTSACSKCEDQNL